MSRYDGLIIPRSYSEYLNKTDSATLSQMLQHLTGLWSHAVSSGDNKPVISDAVYKALNKYQPFKRNFINPENNNWGINKNQILSTSDLITLLENKGFLATKSDPSYKNCTVSFRHSYAAQVFLQINSSIKVSLISATINCESHYDGDSNWLGFQKILIIGKDFLATYTMGGWSYYTKDNKS